MPIRIAIIEDHAPIREILGEWIEQDPELKLVGLFPDAQKAIAKHVEALADVVLVDINMPGINGIECVRTLKPLNAKVNYMMLTAYHDAQLIFDALSAGASGYLLKRSSREELIAAITFAHNGGNPMSSNITQTVVEALKSQPAKDKALEALTLREREVLECMANGMRHKEIATHFGVSYNTVHTLICRLYEKLDVHTSKEAIAKLKKA